MKKNYNKPTVYIENFHVNQSIAKGCTALENVGGSANQADERMCGWELDGEIYFDLSIGLKCSSGELEWICYNAPDEDFLMFHS